MVQNGVPFLIAKAYISKCHFALYGRHFHRVFRIFYIDRLINGFKDTLQIGDGCQQGVIEACQSVDGSPEAADISGKGNQHTHGQRSVRRENPADPQHIDEGCGDGGNNIHAWPHGEV